MRFASNALLGCALLTGVALAATALAQHQGHEHQAPKPAPSEAGAATQAPAGARKGTMEGVPRAGRGPVRWEFALPGGDAAKGRQVFADLECYKCHAIQGENFPAAGADAKNVGPELTGMGDAHPRVYLAQSTLVPTTQTLLG